jgi:formylglycine-generating enzyme required for sulfatase activity
LFLSRRVLTLLPPLLAIVATGQQTQEREKDKGALAHSLEAVLDGSGFVRVPAGEFTMGSNDGNDDEKPPHRVRISQPFEMSKYEVTQAQWTAVMGSAHAGPSGADPSSSVNPSHFRGSSLPVEHVDWNAVQLFLDKLNARDPKYTYRLPTEAEWEYAARAGIESGNSKDGEDNSWCATN